MSLPHCALKVKQTYTPWVCLFCLLHSSPQHLVFPNLQRPYQKIPGQISFTNNLYSVEVQATLTMHTGIYCFVDCGIH